jgi:hypothetical protein
MYKRNSQARSRNHCCRGKAISITYSECVFVALVIQHAKGTHRAIGLLSSVACLVLPYFPHYLINGTIFGKTLLNIKCVLFVSTTLPDTFIILRRTERGTVINAHRYLYKVPVILVRARGGAVGWGTALQTGTSRVRWCHWNFSLT